VIARRSGYSQAAGQHGTIEFDTPLGGLISAVGIRATPTETITAARAMANSISSRPS